MRTDDVLFFTVLILFCWLVVLIVLPGIARQTTIESMNSLEKRVRLLEAEQAMLYAQNRHLEGEVSNLKSENRTLRSQARQRNSLFMVRP